MERHGGHSLNVAAAMAMAATVINRIIGFLLWLGMQALSEPVEGRRPKPTLGLPSGQSSLLLK
jgi:hypothetical protein